MRPFAPFSMAAAALLLSGCSDYSVARSTVDDAFTQRARESGVDVLWAMDTSASMYEEQATLAAHGAAFTDVLVRGTVPFRLAVSTTEPGEPGVLSAPVLDDTTADLASAFAATIETTADQTGDRTERGFDAVLAALDPAGQALEGTGDLEVVFFTDEDDSSEVDADSFVQRLSNMRADALVRVNAIAGDLPEGCFSSAAAADAGVRYDEAVRASGGRRESICSQDIDGALARVALAVLGLDDTFYLSDVPVLSSMEVRVDDALVPQRDNDGWRYDPGINAVIFDGLAVPPPGAGISIEYYDWRGNVDTGG
jgi:hypothetical protein